MNGQDVGIQFSGSNAVVIIVRREPELFESLVVACQCRVYRAGRVPAAAASARTSELLVFDHPKLFTIIEAQFLFRLDVFVSVESDAREGKILMVEEHLHGCQVGRTQMVDEPGNVAIVTSVNAEGVTVPVVKVKEVRVVLPLVSLKVSDNLTNILTHVRSFEYPFERPHSPAFTRGTEKLEMSSDTVLHNTVVAR